MVRWLHLTGCALVALLIAPSVLAKPAFVSSVPNAATFGCNACHDSAFDPVTWNAFGVDLQETMVAGLPDWAAVCGLDSDGDGATNGEELADPDCEWVFGDSDPSGDVYDPSDPDATPPSDDRFVWAADVSAARWTTMSRRLSASPPSDLRIPTDSYDLTS